MAELHDNVEEDETRPVKAVASGVVLANGSVSKPSLTKDFLEEHGVASGDIRREGDKAKPVKAAVNGLDLAEELTYSKLFGNEDLSEEDVVASDGIRREGDKAKPVKAAVNGLDLAEELIYSKLFGKEDLSEEDVVSSDGIRQEDETKPSKAAVSGWRLKEESIFEPSVTEDLSEKDDLSLDEIRRELSNLALRIPKRLLADGTAGGCRDPEPDLPGPRVSEAELQQHRVDALYRVLDKLHLKEYQESFHEALQMGDSAEQSAQRGAVPFLTKDIDLLTLRVTNDIGMRIVMADNNLGLVEEIFLALFRNEKPEIDCYEVAVAGKPMLDLIDAYNTESAMIPVSFYKDYSDRDLDLLAKRVWINYVCSESALMCGKYINYGNDIERTLSRISEELCWRLRRSMGDTIHFIRHAREVFEMGRQLVASEKPIHGIFAFYAASDLFEQEDGGYVSMVCIAACVHEAHLAVEKIEDQTLMILGRVVPLMETMVLRMVWAGEDKEFLDEFSAKCWGFIGVCYYVVGEYDDSKEEFKRAIKLMEKFEGVPGKYKAYGDCLHYIALSYHNMRATRKAAKKFAMLLEAYENAEDWENDKEKNFVMEVARYNIKVTERRTGTTSKVAPEQLF